MNAANGGSEGRRRGNSGGASPDFTVFGAPGSNRPGLGSGRMSIACVIHLDQQQGVARLGATRATVVADPGIGTTPVCGVRSPKRRYGLQHLAQKGEEVGMWLTEVRIGQKRDADMPAARSGGGVHAELGRS